MNIVKEIQRINERELELGLSASASWHAKYSHSAYIFIGGLDYKLKEGDIICVFSQFGEIVDCNLIRDKVSGASRGFAFLAFEDQRSAVLAVDNMGGAKLLDRTLRVDHADRYRRPKRDDKDKDKDRDDPEKVFEGEDDEDYDVRRKKIWDYELYDTQAIQSKEDKAEKAVAAAAVLQTAHQDRVLKLLAARKIEREEKKKKEAAELADAAAKGELEQHLKKQELFPKPMITLADLERADAQARAMALSRASRDEFQAARDEAKIARSKNSFTRESDGALDEARPPRSPPPVRPTGPTGRQPRMRENADDSRANRRKRSRSRSRDRQ